MENIPLLLPKPRSVKPLPGICSLSGKRFILLDAPHPQFILFSAIKLKEGLLSYSHLPFEIVATTAIPKEDLGISLKLDQQAAIKPQGYRLRIAQDAIVIEARDEQGIFYACCTLIQILQDEYFSGSTSAGSQTSNLACLEIEDWPDFANRGVLLDISRDKVPTMETIFNLADLLSSWKINQLQLYTEHTFAYQNHPEVWKDASPFTGEEILKLDAFCKQRYIELVPNQNSFGHLEPWLNLPRYNHLAEAPQGFDFPWGHHDGPFSLCPSDPGSIELLSGLYDELLPHFSSRQVNVGCDETFDIGQGRSKRECEKLGSGRVYLDFLLKIYQEVSKRGSRMQFWGDIIMGHPELVSELPKDVIALDWGYEASHPFDEHCARFAQAGLDFYVCPGTSAWNSIAGRTENCLKNLASAAVNGLKHGAIGFLNTDWGDNGHWQALPVSYLGFAAGAAFAWCYQVNQDLDIRQALSHFAFLDPTDKAGSLAYDLGNVYKEMGIEPDNESVVYLSFKLPFHELTNYLEPETAIKAYHHTLVVIDQVENKFSDFTSLQPDNALLQREFDLTVSLLCHACMRGLYGFRTTEYSQSYLRDDLLKIITEYRSVWLSRNRPGGLQDSLSRFETVKKDYE